MPEQIQKAVDDYLSLVGDPIKRMLPKKPNKPAPPPPTRMPTKSDAQAEKKKSIRDQLARRGRASTILTDPGATDKLGV